VGIEKIWYHQGGDNSSTISTGKNVFLEVNEVLKSFDNDVAEEGHYTYPFELAIPDWAQNSMVYYG